MKLLFDQNLSHRLCDELSDLFPGAAHVRLLGLAEAVDHMIWEFARANDFTIVSMDSDFADMAVFYGPPPKVVWLRSGNQPTSVIASRLRKHAKDIFDFSIDDASACLEVS